MLEHWIANHFQPGPAQRWRRWLVNQGRLVVGEDALRLVIPKTNPQQYSNAQIDDYAGLPREQYPWRPPLRMTVRARFGQTPLGTAGFGFWNHPFAPQTGIGALPRALWFFYASPPTDLPIAYGVPGHGWKVATIDTLRPQALGWAPFAPPVVLLNQFPAAYRRIWPKVQRDLHIAEALLDRTLLNTLHDYRLEWRLDGVQWSVDGKTVFETDRSPRGPLGFVTWIDNQYAVATPQGRLGWGLIDVRQPQWLDLASVQIEQL